MVWCWVVDVVCVYVVGMCVVTCPMGVVAREVGSVLFGTFGVHGVGVVLVGGGVGGWY